MEQRLVSFRSIKAAINRGVQLGFMDNNTATLNVWYQDIASNQIRGWCWNQERGDLFHIKGIVVDNVRVYISSATYLKMGLNTALSGELSQRAQICAWNSSATSTTLSKMGNCRRSNVDPWMWKQHSTRAGYFRSRLRTLSFSWVDALRWSNLSISCHQQFYRHVRGIVSNEFLRRIHEQPLRTRLNLIVEDWNITEHHIDRRLNAINAIANNFGLPP